jgi:coproporphyrinogen III oxidase
MWVFKFFFLNTHEKCKKTIFGLFFDYIEEAKTLRIFFCTHKKLTIKNDIRIFLVILRTIFLKSFKIFAQILHHNCLTFID